MGSQKDKHSFLNPESGVTLVNDTFSHTFMQRAHSEMAFSLKMKVLFEPERGATVCECVHLQICADWQPFVVRLWNHLNSASF